MHPKPVPLLARVTPLQVKDMILGVFPGLHSEIEELMTSMYGDAYASIPGSSPILILPAFQFPTTCKATLWCPC